MIRKQLGILVAFSWACCCWQPRAAEAGVTHNSGSLLRVEKTNRSSTLSQGERKLLLEKYFLLTQKKKLDRVTHPTPEMLKYRRMIRFRLLILNHQLEKCRKYRPDGHFVGKA
jgi:hypothetical protein